MKEEYWTCEDEYPDCLQYTSCGEAMMYWLDNIDITNPPGGGLRCYRWEPIDGRTAMAAWGLAGDLLTSIKEMWDESIVAPESSCELSPSDQAALLRELELVLESFATRVECDFSYEIVETVTMSPAEVQAFIKEQWGDTER